MPPGPRSLACWICLTLTYAATIIVGRHLTVYPLGGPPVAWPASGLLFAAFVLTRPPTWPYLVLACIAGLSITLRVAEIAVANIFVIVPFVCGPTALGAAVVHWLEQRPNSRWHREDRRAAAVIGMGGIVVPALIAGLFTLFYANSTGGYSGRLYLTTWGLGASEFWRARFAGASLGIITIAPFVIAAWDSFRRGTRRPGSRERLIDLAILSLVCAVALAVFTLPGLPRDLRSPSIIIPFVVLISLRGSQRLTSFTNLVVSWIMIGSTLVERGSFAMFFASPVERSTALQVFIFINVCSQTAFTAVIAGRTRLADLLSGRGEELKRLNEDLIRAKEAAVRANAAKGRVLAHVTHEIRTPLGAMIGFAELALTEHQDPATANYLEIIKRNGQCLNEMVDQTLDLSKIESGHFTIDPRPLDARALIDEIIALMQVKAREKALHLHARVDARTPVEFRTDPLRVRQVLMNLVGNAVKFTDHGSVTLAVGAVDAEPRRLVFTVRDTGRGLSEIQAPRVFDPFQQADAAIARTHGGTGLGLSLSRELARLLGGDVILKESRVGVGTRFEFSIAEIEPPDAPVALSPG